MSAVKSIMIRERGADRSFRCSCGCNVFHHPEERTDRYECNACGAWYFDAGESGAAPVSPKEAP